VAFPDSPGGTRHRSVFFRKLVDVQADVNPHQRWSQVRHKHIIIQAMCSNGRSGSGFLTYRDVRDSCSFQQTKGLLVYPQAFLFMLHLEVDYASERAAAERAAASWVV